MSRLRDFEANFASTDWQLDAEAICNSKGFGARRLIRAGGTDHIVFFVGDELLLKIFRPERSCFERERNGLEFALGKTGFQTPEIVASGDLDGLDYLVMTQIHGREITRTEFLGLDRKRQSTIIEQLASGLCKLHANSAVGFENDWPEFVAERAATFIERQIAQGVNRKIIDQLPGYLDESLAFVPLEPVVFLHGDVHFGNLRFSDNGRISGLFDFSDSRVGWHEYDILALGVLMFQGERDLQREFLRAYGYGECEMDEQLRRRLMMLTMLYETADLRRYAMRLRPDAVELDLYELEEAIWNFV